jgi:hypothetical protein
MHCESQFVTILRTSTSKFEINSRKTIEIWSNEYATHKDFDWIMQNKKTNE